MSNVATHLECLMKWQNFVPYDWCLKHVVKKTAMAKLAFLLCSCDLGLSKWTVITCGTPPTPCHYNLPRLRRPHSPSPPATTSGGALAPTATLNPPMWCPRRLPLLPCVYHVRFRHDSRRVASHHQVDAATSQPPSISIGQRYPNNLRILNRARSPPPPPPVVDGALTATRPAPPPPPTLFSPYLLRKLGWLRHFSWVKPGRLLVSKQPIDGLEDGSMSDVYWSCSLT
jgi:hypothetical protein